MTAKKKSSTDSQKIDRTYRRQIAMDRRLTDIEAIQRLDHEVRALNNVTMKAQADTIRRLLRQHDTLKLMPSWPQMERELVAANAFVSEPLKPGQAFDSGPVHLDGLTTITRPVASHEVVINFAVGSTKTEGELP